MTVPYPKGQRLIDRHLMKLRLRDDVSPEEEEVIRQSVAEFRECPGDRVVIKAGDELNASTLLLDGLICRYKDLRNGQRQITALHLPGDFLDLHSFTLKRLDQDVMTLIPSRIALVPHQAIRDITENHPHLTRLFWFMTNLDAAIHREWELSLGRRTALERVAHLLCELLVRFRVCDLADETGYDLRMTQGELSECVGLTPVHTNRVLKELRDRNLVEFRNGRVRIEDWPGLQHVADFDSAYLYLERRPR